MLSVILPCAELSHPFVGVFHWWFRVLVSVCVSSMLSRVLGLVRFIAWLVRILEDWYSTYIWGVFPSLWSSAGPRLC